MPTANVITDLSRWKQVAVAATAVTVMIPLAVGPHALAAWIQPAETHSTIAIAAILGICMTLATIHVVLFVARIPPAAVFIRWPTRTTIRWTCFGVALAGMLVVGSLAVGDGGILRTAHSVETWFWFMTGALAVGLWTGILEEFVFRGVLLSILGRAWHWPGAILVTSFMFAFAHHAYADHPLSAALYVILTGVAGIVFATITIRTGNVWNAIGLHAAWNTLFHERILAFEEGAERALFVLTGTADSWVTGGTIAEPTGSPLAIWIWSVGLLFILYRPSWQAGDLR